MSNRPFYIQLSSVMETMARTAVAHVCKLVEEDSADMRSELSRVLVQNAALTEKLRSLQCELTTVRGEALVQTKQCRTVGVQAGVAEEPTIAGIFGKDWCINLWKEGDPYSLERVIYPTQLSDKPLVSLHSPVVIKEEALEEDIGNSCPQEIVELDLDEDEDCFVRETEGPSIEYSLDDSSSCASVDQDEEPVTLPGDVNEHSVQLMSIDGSVEGYVSPVEGDSDPGDDATQTKDTRSTIPAASDPTLCELQTSFTCSENSATPHGEADDNLDGSSLHTSTDPNRDTFTCPVCNRTFFHKSSLTKHMKHHELNYCHICEQPFHKHEKTHVCVPPVRSRGSHHTCGVCGKAFANPSAVRIHSVVHTGEKPHVCSFCGKRFTQKGNLKCHLRIHTGERPFQCPKCSRTFTQKINLSHHLKAHRNVEVRKKQSRNKNQNKS